MEKIKLFEKELLSLGYTKLTLAEKKKLFKRLGIEFPKRTTKTHHLQDMYVFERDGYRGVINSGIVRKKLLKPGLSWAMITADDKPLFSRPFMSKKDDPSQIMLDRMLAYAYIIQNIILKRPLEGRTGKLKDLVEKEEKIITDAGETKRALTDFWVCEHEPDEYVFKPSNQAKYLENVPKSLKILFLRKERQIKKNFETRKAKLFRKEIRKTARITKPENRTLVAVNSKRFKSLVKNYPSINSTGKIIQ